MAFSDIRTAEEPWSICRQTRKEYRRSEDYLHGVNLSQRNDRGLKGGRRAACFAGAGVGLKTRIQSNYRELHRTDSWPARRAPRKNASYAACCIIASTQSIQHPRHPSHHTVRRIRPRRVRASVGYTPPPPVISLRARGGARTCFPSPSGCRGRTKVRVVTPLTWVMVALVISWDNVWRKLNRARVYPHESVV